MSDPDLQDVRVYVCVVKSHFVLGNWDSSGGKLAEEVQRNSNTGRSWALVWPQPLCDQLPPSPSPTSPSLAQKAEGGRTGSEGQGGARLGCSCFVSPGLLCPFTLGSLLTYVNQRARAAGQEKETGSMLQAEDLKQNTL